VFHRAMRAVASVRGMNENFLLYIPFIYYYYYIVIVEFLISGVSFVRAFLGVLHFQKRKKRVSIGIPKFYGKDEDSFSVDEDT